MDIKDYLKDEIEKSKNIDPERVILNLSNFMSYYTYFRDKFDNYYETDKIRFYETAVKNKLYNERIFTDKRLTQEISMRRIFAILLVAEEDETIKDFVLKTIESFELTKNLIKAVKSKNASKVDDCYKNFNESDNTLKCYCKILVLYCIHIYFGFDSDNLQIGVIRYTHYNAVKNVLYASNKNYVNQFESIDYFEYVTIRRDHKKVFRQIKSLGDILSIVDIKVDKNGMDINLLSNSLKPLFDTVGGYETMLDLYRFILVMTFTFNYFGLSPTCFYQEVKLNDDDKKTILKIAAKAYSGNATKAPPELPFYYYIVTALFYQTAKGMKEDRDSFFKNNSETQFFALKEYEKQIEHLTTEISSLQEKLNEERLEKEKYKSLYSKLQSEFFESQLKNERRIFSTFKEELDALKDKISSLEEKLIEKDKDEEELHRLRELAFSFEETYVPTENKLDLKELINGKKIIIIGGHIDLRNKLSEKYKDLIIIDGHNVNFDESILRTADFVIFNTSNMSHSMYYKAMPVLKNASINFDYIGKYTSLEKLEAQICDLLQK